MPDGGPGAGCALRLQRWIRQLAGGLVCPQEGLVLRSHGPRLPRRRWLRDDVGAVRLQRWLRQLEGRLVRCEEGLVLHSHGSGLRVECRRLRLSLTLT